MTLKIIRQMGGQGGLARCMRMKETRVHGWLRDGIPKKVHADILKLAAVDGLHKIITPALLLETVAQGRAYRAEHNRGRMPKPRKKNRTRKRKSSI